MEGSQKDEAKVCLKVRRNRILKPIPNTVDTEGAHSRMKKQVIKFVHTLIPRPLPEAIILTPEDIGWSKIKNKMVDLEVSNWDVEYCNLTIMDGSEWSLTVCSPELNVRSKGLNSYPPNFDAVQDFIESSAA